MLPYGPVVNRTQRTSVVKAPAPAGGRAVQPKLKVAAGVPGVPGGLVSVDNGVPRGLCRPMGVKRLHVPVHNPLAMPALC